MRMMSTPTCQRVLLASVCGLAWLTAVQTPLASGRSQGRAATAKAHALDVGVSAGAGEKGASGSAPNASATLEGCVTSVLQSERSATFSGEMTAVPGAARMEISIALLERLPGEVQYHLVSAPGLGTWRSSAAGVKIYTYIKQVTDLAAPAFYRGELRFRWLSSKDRPIKVAQLRTTRCEQPAASTTGTGTAPSSQPGAGAPSS
jgi:hypothetical protein